MQYFLFCRLLLIVHLLCLTTYDRPIMCRVAC